MNEGKGVSAGKIGSSEGETDRTGCSRTDTRVAKAEGKAKGIQIWQPGFKRNREGSGCEDGNGRALNKRCEEKTPTATSEERSGVHKVHARKTGRTNRGERGAGKRKEEDDRRQDL